ncbi:MAG: UDP-N-acetylmuramoyl-tripeptide--D-alanyl-D-alanine ligase [Candidatus Paceibacteria bacterium]
MRQLFKSCIVAILTFEAKVVLRRSKPTIIAITGSVGKTSTKDAIFTVLKDTYRTRKSQKSFNSEIGVPLSILALPNAWDSVWGWTQNIIDGFFIAFFSRQYPQVLVLEVGVDRPGDMANITKWLKPDIVVMTRLPDVPVHVEYFGTPEAVVAEKMELAKALKPDGIFIYNNDDIKLQEVAKEVRQKSFGYSRYLQSHFTASEDKVIYNDDIPVGMSLVLSHLTKKVTMRIEGSIGIQHNYTIAAAAAVASHFDISLERVAAALEGHVPAPGRMQIIPGLKHTIILDDTYNASPIAMELALQTLGEIRGAKRKIAVLGDMMELGQFSSNEHERIGALVPKCADMLLTLGIRSRKIAEGALENGLSEKVIWQYDDIARAGRELQNFLQPGDVVLIKASQSIRAERVVEEIMAEPERASELLVRQDSSWKTR